MKRKKPEIKKRLVDLKIKIQKALPFEGALFVLRTYPKNTLEAASSPPGTMAEAIFG
jgi:hypothetical protein